MKKTIMWFKNDLRLTDNLALEAACHEAEVIFIYILQREGFGKNSFLWLKSALQGIPNLNVYEGDPLKILPSVAQKNSVTAIYHNRTYEPHEEYLIERLTSEMEKIGCTLHSCNSNLLWEAPSIMNKTRAYYQVYTPFYKQCMQTPVRKLALKPSTIRSINLEDSIALEPEITLKDPHEILRNFIKEDLSGYKDGRNFPAKNHTSKLSPYLHFGQISPVEIWYTVHTARESAPAEDFEHFIKELVWREFSYYLLYHAPTLPEENFNKKFDNFPWTFNSELLEKWKSGQTGYPIVDAGMRELSQTGYMHNRVRMIVASFLVKNLLIHWHHGRDWFWENLYDADLASNSASWQWVAGSGADAAPYYRIFNPMRQVEKFDPEGEYILKYVPELKTLPREFLVAPWEHDCTACGIELGVCYPKPIVDFNETRDRALLLYKTHISQAAEHQSGPAKMA